MFGAGRRQQYNRVKYHGGHPERPNPTITDGVLVLDDMGLHLRGFRELFVVPWPEVIGVAVEGPDMAQQRVTMTRMALMGPFAWAAKKTTSDVYLQVQTATFQVGFQIPKTSGGAVRAAIAAFTPHLHGQQPNGLQPTPTAPPPGAALTVAAPAPPTPQGPPPGWYVDPEGSGHQRWWDGTAWTEHVQAG